MLSDSLCCVWLCWSFELGWVNIGFGCASVSGNVLNDGWMRASDARLLSSELVTVTFTRVFCTSSTATRSVFAPSVQPACKPWPSSRGCGPPLLPPPSQCICSFVLPPACQSHSCQPSPGSGRTRINCVHATAKANVYMAKVLIRLRQCGFDPSGAHAQRAAHFQICAAEELRSCEAKVAFPHKAIKWIQLRVSNAE